MSTKTSSNNTSGIVHDDRVITSYEQTEKVHNLLCENLKKEEDRLTELMEYERNVALQIEDTSRVILSIKRAIATLKHGLPVEVVKVEPEFDVDAYLQNVSHLKRIDPSTILVGDDPEPNYAKAEE